MNVRNLLSVVVMLILICVVSTVAQEQAGENMPEIGPPAQMQHLAYLEGKWNFDMQWQDEKDTSKWNSSKGACTYTKILDGCAMQSTFKSDMMGMLFEGFMVQNYDREKNEWQAAWIDNMSARLSLYTGKTENGKTSLVGEDMWQGKTMLSRMSTFNETPTSFDWTMETSFDGGKTWLLMGKAKYTKVNQ